MKTINKDQNEHKSECLTQENRQKRRIAPQSRPMPYPVVIHLMLNHHLFQSGLLGSVVDNHLHLDQLEGAHQPPPLSIRVEGGSGDNRGGSRF